MQGSRRQVQREVNWDGEEVRNFLDVRLACLRADSRAKLA